MNKNLSSPTWWGAPKKFSTDNVDRKISWLELFYDLVYVIAISTITHYLAQHFSGIAMLDYLYLFMIIFWGWLNGSHYHDLHGTEGLRTKLMTLWQMVILAALVVTLHSAAEQQLHNATIVLSIMQIYITYLWWSVGLYDKEHRKLNRPFSFCYLISFVLILSTLFLDQPFIRIVFYIALLLNYAPPFISYYLRKGKIVSLSLSSSMTERLGLFTIILFGEVVLGVINGVIATHELQLQIWIQFILAISIVFALWWLFFTIVSERGCRSGLLNSSILELLFIATLIGLGMLGAMFNDLFIYYDAPGTESIWVKSFFGFSISLFLLGICAMMYFLIFPEIFLPFKKTAQRALFIAAILIGIFTYFSFQIPLAVHLLLILLMLVILILFLNGLWYKMQLSKPSS